MLRTIWQKWFHGDEHSLHTPKDVSAHFVLRYHELPIGFLSLDSGKWQFRYSDEFRKRELLRPIVEFPDTGRIYESDELWPFFSMRIPSLKQFSIEEIVKKESIDSNDELQLLRRFGRKTVSNPFELVEARIA